MAGGWGSVLTELIPLAVVITLSPLSIIPAVLVLHTARPRPTGLSFLAGWLAGLLVLTAVFVGVSGALGGFEKPPSWASWVRIVIGAALIVFGVYRWLTRHSSTHTPVWLRGIGTLTPGRAGGTAMALTAVNPKVLFVCAAAGLTIGTAGLGTPEVWLAVVYFAAVAGSSAAAPILAYAVSDGRLDPPLARLRDWLEQHNAALMAGVLVVIGVLVLFKGLHGLGG